MSTETLKSNLSPSERRHGFREWFTACRQGTLALVADLDEEVLRSRPHDGFSPIGWHLGHVAYTEALWLLQTCDGQASLRPEWERLFRQDGMPKGERKNLPSRNDVFGFLDEVRSAIYKYLERAPLERDARIWHFVLQHESQHDETISVVRRLMGRDGGVEPLDGAADAGLDDTLIAVDGGLFEMGTDAVDALDNERPTHPVDLAPFRIDRHPVTQGRFRAFIDAGGYAAENLWHPDGWAWLQQYAVKRPLYWRDGLDDRPVCGLSWYEADAFARFIGRRLPSEAEWERASRPVEGRTGDSFGGYPWGGAAPNVRLANFDWRRGWTAPIERHAAGASAAGVEDLLGNVWEWTASPLAPYPGFEPFPYARYSATYFDGRHYVLRGGSWASRPWVLRRTFRNFYEPHVREIFAGFRCAVDG